jgi:ribonuclease BN (tRNA processing enzyme)
VIEFESSIGYKQGMKELNLHFLGTAGYHPNNKRHTACLFMPEYGLMFDAGTGLFRAIDLATTDTLEILLSHAHLDHVFGLTFLLDLLYKSPVKQVRVYGEAEKLQAVRTHLFHPTMFPVVPPIQWIALEELPNGFKLCGAQLNWFRLDHPGGSVGYRLDWPDTSLAYVTDTTCRPDSDYWVLIDEVEYLVHECNFTDDQSEFAVVTGHSWPSAVFQKAVKHRIKNLWLTHMNPLVESDDPLELNQPEAEAFRPFSGGGVATDGLVLSLRGIPSNARSQ